jgi:uncharacterized protein YjbI with pentapeptide repeats
MQDQRDRANSRGIAFVIDNRYRWELFANFSNFSFEKLDFSHEVFHRRTLCQNLKKDNLADTNFSQEKYDGRYLIL